MSDEADLKAQRSLSRLLGVMRRLRSPDGCPWDREQDFASIAPYTIEEAYEVAEAIARGEPRALEGELGDLLFQVVFHAQMGAERQWFDFASVAESIADKLTERHPHVFADARIESVADQNRAWEEHKARLRRVGDEDMLLYDIPWQGQNI
ncbi:MAG TPA: MazG nucleotide pyrophosphohydrolase domain-containing protein, partial [Steroidobacteraceae bacterium]